MPDIKTATGKKRYRGFRPAGLTAAYFWPVKDMR
jgi:hypothetical protein